MPPIIVCNVAALLIAALFYLWRDCYLFRLSRRRLLHERVAYMLWAAAARSR
ncbi:MAG TPA: hypothetical protein VIL46_18130 [Gemmataceae bacterium]